MNPNNIDSLNDVEDQIIPLELQVKTEIGHMVWSRITHTQFKATLTEPTINVLWEFYVNKQIDKYSLDVIQNNRLYSFYSGDAVQALYSSVDNMVRLPNIKKKRLINFVISNSNMNHYYDKPSGGIKANGKAKINMRYKLLGQSGPSTGGRARDSQVYRNIKPTAGGAAGGMALVHDLVTYLSGSGGAKGGGTAYADDLVTYLSGLGGVTVGGKAFGAIYYNYGLDGGACTGTAKVMEIVNIRGLGGAAGAGLAFADERLTHLVGSGGSSGGGTAKIWKIMFLSGGVIGGTSGGSTAKIKEIIKLRGSGGVMGNGTAKIKEIIKIRGSSGAKGGGTATIS